MEGNNLIKKGLVVAVILLFIGVSVIPSTGTTVVKKFTIPSFYDGNTLYVGGNGPGNYSKIQDAIDNASDGDTVFVYSGTYYENLEVNKSINLIGEDKDITIINGSEYRILWIDASFIKINGFTLENAKDNYFDEAIVFGRIKRHIENICISDCIMKDCGEAVLFFSTVNVSNVSITNCYMHNNSDASVRLRNSDNIAIKNCTLENNGEDSGSGWYKIGGIDIGGWNCTCSNISILDCVIRNNIGWGISIAGNSTNIDIAHNKICYNTWYGVDMARTFQNSAVWDNNISNNGEAGVFLQSAYGLTIKHNVISSNNEYGINLQRSSDNTILENDLIGNNKNGIRPHSSNNNNIVGNTISNNHPNGIYLYKSCNNNIISGNIVIDNNGSGIRIGRFSNSNTVSANNINSNKDDGICLYKTTNNTILVNNITDNNKSGIFLTSSSSNFLSENDINSNNNNGILLYNSSSNNITGNNIISNNDNGIELDESSSNTILKNNFLDNQRHAIFKNCKNTWKHNYWNRPRILPKLIFGIRIMYNKWSIPWINLDWNPAREPYDIDGGDSVSVERNVHCREGVGGYVK